MRIPKLRFLQRIPDTFPFTPGWRLFPGEGKLQEARRCLPIRYFSRFPRLLRFILTALLFLYWPFRLLVLSFSFSKKFGSRVRLESGKRVSVQFAEQFWLALACGVLPREYYSFELFKRKNWNNAHLYYYLSDMRRVPTINIGNESNANAVVNNKETFEVFCVAKQLPHCVSCGIIQKGHGDQLGEIISKLSDGCYVLKPFIGCRGEGVVFFSIVQQRCLIDGNENLSHEEAISRLSFFINRSDYLLQPRLYNHEELKKVGNGSLVSFRIVTLLNKEGKAEFLSAIAQIPFAQQRVSNKGLIAPVNEFGILGEGQLLRPLSPIYSALPEGGETFAGITVPCWNDAVKVALTAHTALGAFVSLGWDVAITPQGPVLLEANSGWDPTMMQKTHHLPLGKTVLPEMILYYCSEK